MIVFFVTSSDSGSLVIDTITAGGKTDGPLPQRVFWCVFEGLGGDRAAAWRRSGRPAGDGGHDGLSVRHALLLLMCVSIFIALRRERRKI